MDEKIVNFMSITDTSVKKAESYLRVSDGDLAQAIQLFFDTGGIDIDLPSDSHTPSAGISSGPTAVSGIQHDPITIDEDIEDEDLNAALNASHYSSHAGPASGGVSSERPASPPVRNVPTAVEDDEAMAMRLQQEIYGNSADPNAVRAPIARTTETLVGPEEDFVARMRGPRTSKSKLFVYSIMTRLTL